jgi:hypothetical protein
MGGKERKRVFFSFVNHDDLLTALNGQRNEGVRN